MTNGSAPTAWMAFIWTCLKMRLTNYQTGLKSIGSPLLPCNLRPLNVISENWRTWLEFLCLLTPCLKSLTVRQMGFVSCSLTSGPAASRNVTHGEDLLVTSWEVLYG